MHAIRESDPAIRSGALAVLLLGAASSARRRVRALHRTRRRRRPPRRPRPTRSRRIEIYGFGQADAIADFKQNNPNWSDVNPAIAAARSSPNQFGDDGRFYRRASARAASACKGHAADRERRREDAVRVRHVRHRRATPARRRSACATRGASGARSAPARPRARSWTSTSSRTSLEYWGPNGMLFFRNVAGVLRAVQRRQLECDGSRSRRRAPAATPASSPTASSCRTSSRASRRRTSPAHYRVGEPSGATSRSPARCATSRGTTCSPTTQFDLSGHALGLGRQPQLERQRSARATSLRLQLVDGAGIENYINDAPVDVGIKSNPGNAVTPVAGEALPIFGLVALPRSHLERRSSRARSATRASTSTTATARRPTPTRPASTPSANLLYTPVKNVMMGGELQWGQPRELLRRLLVATTSGSSSRSSTTSRAKMGGQ